jgi:hypothetical protein
LKVLWIGGWAISPESVHTQALKHFPQMEHSVVAPTAEIPMVEDFDWLVGHSLGAFLMLLWPDRFTAKRGSVLLSPFVEFPREADRGGKMSKTQLKVTARGLRTDALTTVNDFYGRADLGMNAKSLPYPVEDLAWGLDLLLEKAVNPETISRRYHEVLLGGQDPILDASRLLKFFPAAKVLPEAGHRFEDLLEELRFDKETHV